MVGQVSLNNGHFTLFFMVFLDESPKFKLKPVSILTNGACYVDLKDYSHNYTLAWMETEIQMGAEKFNLHRD